MPTARLSQPSRCHHWVFQRPRKVIAMVNKAAAVPRHCAVGEWCVKCAGATATDATRPARQRDGKRLRRRTNGTKAKHQDNTSVVKHAARRSTINDQVGVRIPQSPTAVTEGFEPESRRVIEVMHPRLRGQR